MSQTAAVFGATGLVGSAIVEELQNNQAFEKILFYSRKPPMLLGPKTEFKPFETDNFSIPEDVDIVFCALGTTIKKAGNQKDFREVDLHAVRRIAVKSKKAGIEKFVVVSSVGANAKSNNFYIRTKGEMEETIKDIGIDKTVVLRPSLLLGKRGEKRWAEDLGKILMRPLSFLMVGPMRQYKPVKAEQVARVMVKTALNNDTGFRIIENREILSFS